MEPMIPALINYHTLIGRVDELCRRILREFPDAIVCRAGCDGCCRHLSLFPVEGMVLTMALEKLPLEQRERIRRRAAQTSPDGPCPLLHENLCLLYDARPIICRTHGLPILTGSGEERAVDFCPLNFQGVEKLPGHAVLDLDRLNATLAAINTVFVNELYEEPSGKERITIAEALLTAL